MKTKVCFDTSVLVAALIQRHPQHVLAFSHLQKVHAREVEGCLTTHALAELYATLTALPLKPKVTPAEAMTLIQSSILNHFALISLSAVDYSNALKLVAGENLTSGIIYDALHLVGARRHGCDHLLTLNLKHFQAIDPGDSRITQP